MKIHQSVLLLGGMFGSGKSTLAAGVEQIYGSTCYNIEFANIYKNIGGVALSQSQQGDNFRDSIWATTITNTINEKLHEGYELIIANSSFLISERRRIVIDYIDPHINTVALIMALPLQTPYHRVKESRPIGSHPVNQENILQTIKKLNRTFVAGDNTDLLLPSDITTLPREYRAMLSRNEINRDMIYNNKEDEEKRKPKWVVVPYNLSPDICIDLVKLQVSDPFLIRSYLETKNQANIEGKKTKTIEGNTPNTYRK
jgi:predicted kinase